MLIILIKQTQSLITREFRGQGHR